MSTGKLLLAFPTWLSRHLSLLVILGSWVMSAFYRFSPGDVAGWSLVHLFTFSLLHTIVTWVLIRLLVHHDSQKIGDLGLGKELLKGSFVPGILFGFCIFVLCNFGVPLLTRGWFPQGEAVPAGDWFQGLSAIPAWIFLGWIAGGLTEEASRVFVLTRFELTFGETGLMIAFVVTSVMFGLGHLYQGKDAAFSLGVSGALYALVYLRRRSCWDAVVAHATFDTIGITIMFLQ